MLRSTLLALSLAAFSTAHTAAWAPGMYCKGGADPTKDDPNTNLAVNPLYNLAKADWWFQHHRGCDRAPPMAGEFLELPANGKVTVELAHNRAHTTLSYNGQKATDWPDGKHHPEDWNGWGTDGTPSMCLKEDGAMHTWNHSSAGGTAFAISYQSNLQDVTMENLVVFTTRYHTPWKRIATYDVPDLPACPEGGCTCAWLWVPNDCGQPNMYMQGFKCNVTGASPTAKPLAKAQVPVYCENEPAKCVKGAKQMLAWHQATGNNIETAQGVTPNYNQKCGWAEGAQKDIFDVGAVQEAVARPHPWSVNSSPDAIEPAVARPHPWSKEDNAVEPAVARPHPWSDENNKFEAAAARPHPWRAIASSAVVPSGIAASSTFATRVTGTPATPTSATEAVSTESCSVRRPRYTPGVAHRWV
ncbi:hypothetical protein HBI56_131270 [Parastagonospora nodorum]|nr:hypothetical protein HBI09_135000 [Parastagonospora nodorum]KAH4047536.1 hypothetical protein HBH49_166500 [Parastagonospora nodorum]KAH4113380.1 hypothetical protein HBH47_212120 [Parastagonospora nodorum]KAH4220127.1 hypothetical protein HBI06_180020 [Parastagonospora nodorum]KAH4227452.1 hypothetical protein HBI05_213050 [Parastagonospora nodorum]